MARIVDLQNGNQREVNKAYLEKAAYCAMVDEIRQARRRRETSLVDEEGEEMPLAGEVPDPEQQLHNRQLGGFIRDCMTALITPRRLVVALKLQGQTGPEAAALLGWSLRKTENLMYRGMADLRECLVKKGVRQ